MNQTKHNLKHRSKGQTKPTKQTTNDQQRTKDKLAERKRKHSKRNKQPRNKQETNNKRNGQRGLGKQASTTSSERIG